MMRSTKHQILYINDCLEILGEKTEFLNSAARPQPQRRRVGLTTAWSGANALPKFVKKW